MAKYSELIVWQKSMDLVEKIYKLSDSLPEDEKYGLTDQMKRAAVSIPSNIAEGSSRKTQKDFCHFLYIALGSNAELRTQLEILVRVGYCAKKEIAEIVLLTNEIGKMISSLIGKLETSS